MVIKTDESSGVYIQFPLPEERLFRNQATEDVLLLLLRHPHREFTVTDLRKTTNHGGDTVDTAIRVLEAADLISTREEGRKKIISANQARFHNPDNPLLSIPQEEFVPPVREFLERLKENQGDNLVGVILFGSVARGEADRTSDIDLQIIVKNGLTETRRIIHDIRQEVEEQEFNGGRYELQLLVESVESAKSYGEKLQKIFSEGIIIYATNKLEEIKEVVFHGE